MQPEFPHARELHQPAVVATGTQRAVPDQQGMPGPIRYGLRLGFTLIELLVVLAVLAIFIAMLLPAVQQARESARRTRCTNNLRQIGIALHQFEGARTYLPPAALDRVSVPSFAHSTLQVPIEAEHGWLAFLLPFFEQSMLHDRYQLPWDWRSEPNRVARETALQTLQCPSTPSPRRHDRGSYHGQSWQAMTTDYGVLSGVDPNLKYRDLIDEATMRAPHGMLRRNELAKLADNLDGTSQTAWIAEDAGRPDRYRARLQRVAGYVAGGGWPSANNYFVVHGASSEGTGAGPCPINCTNDNEIYSFHSRGALALFGDGAVHFLPANVDMRVLASIVTIAAGEPQADKATGR